MILGLDPGSKRVGIALAHEETRFATPLEVIDRTTTDPIARIKALVDEMDVSLVVIGRPVTLAGGAGPAVDEQQRFVADIVAAVEVPVVEHDERLTTLIADQGLKAGGAKRAGRDAVRDAVAAQVMLQGYLDGQR